MSIQVRNGFITSVQALPNRRLLVLEVFVAALLAAANLANVAGRSGSEEWVVLLVPVLAAILFGGYAVYALSQLLRQRPALRVDEAGIMLPLRGGILVPWAAISGAHVEESNRLLGQSFLPFDWLLPRERLFLGFGDEALLERLVPEWRALRTRRDRASGGRELRLGLDRLDVTGRTLLECIDAHLRRTAHLGSAVGMVTSL